jgi:hypothetical protein
MAYKTLATYHQTIGNDASLVKSMFAYAAQLEQMAMAPPPPMPMQPEPPPPSN